MAKKRNNSKIWKRPDRGHLFRSPQSEELWNEWFVVSFAHADRNQGQQFSECESKHLAKMCEIFRNYGRNPLMHSVDGNTFTRYGDFPPKDKTNYTHPEQVPQDAKWASIHLNGKFRIIGYIVKNIFYLVFLDPDHKFWNSPKKHT